MHIDPHVHCRDWNQAYKSTIKDVADLARKQKIVAIFDMPNTDPHHLMYSTKDMKGRKGLTKKVNPPLRDYKTALTLRNYLKEGKIDWIETDHAPHTRMEKFFNPYLSGIPSLKFYSTFLNYLRNWGLTEEQILRLTYHNIKRIFKI